MKLYSTNNSDYKVSYEEAIMKGLAPDKGLFMPMHIPTLEDNFIKNLKNYSLGDLSFEVASAFLGDEIPKEKLKEITDDAINFEAPVVKLDDNYNILELFHGPTLAFKDFGARFMSRTMGYFNRNNDKELVILVATSGDTGGAVASGFYKTPGIKVVILYPSGKVSLHQEKQLTTLGENITALEINGTFDDCQDLVKQAFVDQSLSSIKLSSANSINIARLIPQSFYYFESFKQLKRDNSKIVYTVPSGNLGNITAGIIAKKMGLPIDHFIAATNINDVVPSYINSGEYKPKRSLQTISNAMDVGNPSNFIRMKSILGSTWNNVKENVSGYAITEKETQNEIVRIYNEYNYIIDPHGAVGTLASLKHNNKTKTDNKYVILETAHPAKFPITIESNLNIKLKIPTILKELESKETVSIKMENNYDELKTYLLENF